MVTHPNFLSNMVINGWTFISCLTSILESRVDFFPVPKITLCMNQKEITNLVFCYQNCSDLPWEKTVLEIEKNFWIFEISRAIYSKSERSEQYLVTECFFNWFLEVSHILKIRTIRIQIRKNYLDLETSGKS